MGSGVDVRHRVLLDLAKHDKSDLCGSFNAITEGSAAVLGVERVGIWRLFENQSIIVCEDLYLRGEHQHIRGERLLATDAPHYFEALRENRAIAAHIAAEDPRTAELRSKYLVPHGIASMMDVPIWHRSSLYGVLCHEHVGRPRQWDAGEIDFAGNLADIAALSLEAADRRTAELRWKAVVEAIGEGVAVVNAHGEIEFMNLILRDWVARSGAGDDVNVGGLMRGIDLLDHADRPLPEDRRPSPRALAGETVLAEIYGVRLRSTGEHRYVRATLAPLRREDDTINGYVGVYSDVTEEVQFERLKRDFLATVAHELKTPVAVAKGYSQLLEKTGGFSSKEKTMLSAIVRAADRMDKLIQDIVDVSNIILGRLALSRSVIDLTALASEVVARVSRSTHRCCFAIEASEPLRILADPARIEQALRQLIDNAVRFSPEGSEVLVRVERDGGEAVVTVVDSGVGIPIHNRARLFDLFYRAHADTPEDRGGLGLGLFLVREIVRHHEGIAGFCSTEGRGSSFFFRLPLVVEK